MLTRPDLDPDILYAPTDEPMRQIAALTTLNKWRCIKRGPPFRKFGANVFYAGSDVLDWWDAETARRFNAA